MLWWGVAASLLAMAASSVMLYIVLRRQHWLSNLFKAWKPAAAHHCYSLLTSIRVARTGDELRCCYFDK